MRLWMVRHARPLVEPGTCYGQLDVPVDALHTAQTAQAVMQALPGSRLGALRTSPLQRTRVLARDLGGRLGLCAEEDVRLAEMHFGSWEGVPWSRIPKSAVDAWTADFSNHAFGGQESTQQVLDRVWAALQEAREVGADQLWVTHAGVMRAVQHMLAVGAPVIGGADEWPRQAPGYGGWMAVDL